MAKRFYKAVSVEPIEGGFGIRLDGRGVKTPQRHTLILPTEELARSVAAEWDGVDDEIVMDHLPLTRLAYGGLDKSDAELEQARKEIVSYAGSDLVCYRAEAPDGLAMHQQEIWQPLIDWAASDLSVALNSTSGIIAVSQPRATLDKLARDLSHLSSFEVAGLHPAVALLGSAVIALALFKGRVNADQAVQASLLDELWQEERWGRDEEAEARRARILREIQALERYFQALGR